MEIRFKINNKHIRSLQNELEFDNPLDVMQEALDLLDYVINKTKGKQVVICVVGANGEIEKVPNPNLKRLKRRNCD